MADDNDGKHDDDGYRNTVRTADRTVADKVDIGIEFDRQAARNEIGKALNDVHGRECRNECVEVQLYDQQTVAQPAQESHAERQDQRGRRIDARGHEEGHHDSRKGHRTAYGKVDASGNDDISHADRKDAIQCHVLGHSK